VVIDFPMLGYRRGGQTLGRHASSPSRRRGADAASLKAKPGAALAQA